MKQRSIVLIIGLMSVALLGVMAMQYFFVRESYLQKSQLFDEAVKASLAVVANKLERYEAYEFVQEQERINEEKQKDQQRQREKERLLAKQVKVQEELKKLFLKEIETLEVFRREKEILIAEFPHAIRVTNDFFETYIRRSEYRHLLLFNFETKFLSSGAADINLDISARKSTIPIVKSKDDSVRYIIPNIDLSRQMVTEFVWATLPPDKSPEISFRMYDLEQELKTLTDQIQLVQATNVYDSLAVFGGKDVGVFQEVARSIELSKRPFENRININLAMDLLADEFVQRGISPTFGMDIFKQRKSKPFARRAYNMTPIQIEETAHLTKYNAPLFQGDQGGRSPGILSVYFPSKENIIFNDMMSRMIFPIIALLVVLIGCFAYTLSTIFKQKKISEMKTDFINNMTHEFKTPVATIMIASESLRDPEIASNETRVNKLANIIYDENVRLGSHIERVLNIARLEKENLKIERVDVHMNALTSAVLESMQLQLDKAEGLLNIHLDAQDDLVVGDELHLSNVLYNLVDNAIKYSMEKPEITVKSYNTRKSIIISVSDKGIGMSKDHQEKIFDQFYRIPTGNIHNVKGFGLGLSYVNNIIKILNGRITVKSEKDKGTQFDVILPLKNAKAEELA